MMDHSKPVYIYPNNLNSKSMFEFALGLHKELGAKIIKTNPYGKEDISRDVPEDSFVVNWGADNDEVRSLQKTSYKTFNQGSCMKRISNKNTLYDTLGAIGLSCPSILTIDGAIDNLNRNIPIIGLRKHYSGFNHVYKSEYIPELDDEVNLADYDKFFSYVPKSSEYRIHIVNGTVIYCEQIKFTNRTHDVSGTPIDKKLVNWKIRTVENGFTPTRVSTHLVPQNALHEALRAFNGVPNLHFGYVHVLYSRKKDKTTILSVNPTPSTLGNNKELKDLYVSSVKTLILNY